MEKQAYCYCLLIPSREVQFKSKSKHCRAITLAIITIFLHDKYPYTKFYQATSKDMKVMEIPRVCL